MSNDFLEMLPGYSTGPHGAWVTLPWPTDPDEKMELLRMSLGPSIIDWAEGRTDEPGLIHYQTGEPWRFTDGQKRFLIMWYSLTPDGRWRYRSGVKRGAKGTGKDPFGGCMCVIELIGPSHFVGFDDSGRPIGEPHRMPLVQIASNSEAQSKDMLRVANAIVPQETRDYFGVDCGETRTILHSGGRLEILTASEKSSEGDPATFIALNESHHQTAASGGHRVAEVARRNVGKSPADIQARLCEFTNAHQQGLDSVAERSFMAWQDQVSGRAKKQDILYDSYEAPPDTNLFDDESRMRGLRASYADAPWADLERLSDEILDTRTTVADSIRFYLNGLAAAEDAWINPQKFDELARPDIVIADGDQIALFLDCSKSGDSTGLVGCRLSDGHVFVLGCWQRPHGERGKGWLVPRHEVDTAVRSAFERYDVAWFGVDPSPARDDEDEALYWAPLVDEWHRDYSKELAVWATPGAGGNAVSFDMAMSKRGGKERNQKFTEMAMQTSQDIDEDGSLTHDGSVMLRQHAHNARRRPNQWGVTLGKVNRDSKRLVDLAVCMVGARLGRRLALNSNKLKRKRTGRAAFF